MKIKAGVSVLQFRKHKIKIINTIGQINIDDETGIGTEQTETFEVSASIYDKFVGEKPDNSGQYIQGDLNVIINNNIKNINNMSKVIYENNLYNVTHTAKDYVSHLLHIRCKKEKKE